MDRWKQDRAAPMFSRLCTATDESKRYVEVWEYFSWRLTDDELFELAEGLIRETLRNDGLAASMNRRPALFAVWRGCNRRRRRKDSVEWLSRLIVAAIPSNLRFADDLFYYWGAPRSEILPEGGRAKVRIAMLSAAKTTFTDARSLLRTLGETHVQSDRDSYALLHFVKPPADRSAAELELSERDWLAPLLV